MDHRLPFILPVASGMQQAILAATPFQVWVAALNDAPSFQDELQWLQVINPGDPQADPPVFAQTRLWRAIFKRLETVTIPGVPSAGNQEKWTLYLILPKRVIDNSGGLKSEVKVTSHIPWNIGTAMIRRLRRWLKANAAQNQDAQGRPYLLPPMTIKQVEEQYPAFADKHFRPQQSDGNGGSIPVPGSSLICPIVFNRGEEEMTAAADYRPTDEECDNDTETTEDTLWPPAE